MTRDADAAGNKIPVNPGDLDNEQLQALLKHLRLQFNTSQPDEILKRQINRLQSYLDKRNYREKRVKKQPWYTELTQLENELRANQTLDATSQAFLLAWDAEETASTDPAQQPAYQPPAIASTATTTAASREAQQVFLLLELLIKLKQITTTNAEAEGGLTTTRRFAILNLIARYYPGAIVIPLLQTWLALLPLATALDLPALAELKIKIVAIQKEADYDLTGLLTWRLETNKKVTGWLNTQLTTLGQNDFVAAIGQIRQAARKQAVLEPEQLVPLLQMLQTRWLTLTDNDLLAGQIAELIGATHLTNPARRLAGYKVCSAQVEPEPELDQSPAEVMLPLPLPLFATIQEWESAQATTTNSTGTGTTVSEGKVLRFVSPAPAQLRHMLEQLSPLEFGFFLLYTRLGYTHLPPTHPLRLPLTAALKAKAEMRGSASAGSNRYNPFGFGLGKVELAASNPTSQAAREAVQLLLTHLCGNLTADPATLEKLLADVFTAYNSPPARAWATEQAANATNSPGEATGAAKATTGTGADLATLGVKLPDKASRLWNNFSACTADLASARQARLSHPAYPHIPLPKPLPAGVTVTSLPYRELQMKREWLDQDIWQLPSQLDLQLLNEVWQAELAALRPVLEEWLAGWIVDILSTGIHKEISHSYDPPWDSSGLLTNTPQIFVLEDYRRVADLFTEHNGQSEATYASGWGLAYPDYAEELAETIRREWLAGRCYYQVLTKLEQEHPYYFRQLWDYQWYTSSELPPPDLAGTLPQPGEIRPDRAARAVSGAVELLLAQITENYELDDIQELFSEAETSLPEELLELEIYPLLVKYKQFAALPVFCSRRKLVACGFSSLAAEWETYCYDAAILTYQPATKSNNSPSGTDTDSNPTGITPTTLELLSRLNETSFRIDLNRIQVEVTSVSSSSSSDVEPGQTQLTAGGSESESEQANESGQLLSYVRYGYAANMRELLASKLWQGAGGAVILRSFTSEVDKKSGLPVKELRGWLVEKVAVGNTVIASSGVTEKFVTTRLLPDELYQAYAANPTRPPEEAVRFC